MKATKARRLTDYTVTKENHTMTSLRRLALLTGLASFACLLVAGSALAAPTESAWWHLSLSARPTNLKAGVARNEVQEVAVSATGGEFVLIEEANFEIAQFPWNASAAEVQIGLEAIYGAGNVEVTGGPGDEEGTNPYVITFVGELASNPVAPMNGAFSAIFLNCAGATGPNCKAEARVTEKEKGAADGEIVLTAANLGDETTADGVTNPIQIADTLPPGLEAVAIEGLAGTTGTENRGPVTCHRAPLDCTFEGTLPPFDQLEVRIKVDVLPGASSGETNQFSISGGGALPAQLSGPIAISTAATPFGIEDYEMTSESEGGGLATQAGSHPFQVTTFISLNQSSSGSGFAGYEGHLPALPKDVHFHWPPGFLANPSSAPTCTLAQFLNGKQVGSVATNGCQPETAIGVAMVTLSEPTIGFGTLTVPIFNLEPSFGEPARAGFYAVGVPVLIDSSLRSGGPGADYGVDINVNNITQAATLLTTKATVWGVPGDPRHNNSRGWGCLAETRGLTEPLPCPSSTAPHPPAFATLPTLCSGAPAQTSVEADSWADPHSSAFLAGSGLPSFDGCNRLNFAPNVTSEPTSNAATSPSGLSFDLDFTDEGLLNQDGLAQSQMKTAVVTLPTGFTANPSVAEGLKACGKAEYEAASLLGLGCTPESKVGDVEIESPLIKGKKVTGGLFVAKQHENPYDNLLTLYLIARNDEQGVLVKQALKVMPNPVTGQLTTEVDNVPQLPFSHFHLAFRQGQRSPLITPPTCGTYTVNADLYPYSNPGIPVHRESSFEITQGPEGQPCPSGGVPPFHPNLLAGSENPTAGAYSPFYTEITRRDSEQEITRFSIKLPPGVIGKLAGVGTCSDAQIAAAKGREREGGGQEELDRPSCPAASEVGHTNVGSGVGNVLAYAPGKLYLAGPYHGSNISLVSITAAKVGPFDLGTVVVRFALRIDPETAEVFVDSQGSDPIPHIVDGIPVHLRDIQAFVNRPGFTLNPTSCKKTSTASTVLGSGLNFASEADDQPVTITSPFQVGSCASLGFKPKLALSLKGATKRGGTPALKAVVTYPKGSYANIAKSVVTLPHSEFLEQSHIKTICTRVQFKEGKVPGEKCPKASIYGKATAITPLLSEPLKGPVYLRSSSHNLPDLVAALHNSQVDFALDGRIDSIKNGRIRNTFETVPDAPVSKFVLEMQGGKKGLLVNSTNLCKGTNRAISEFTGQNGKLSNTNPVLKAKCGGKGKKKGKPGGGAHHR